MSVARPISTEDVKKRSPGFISSNEHWAVLDESKKVKDGYVHSCGTDIMGKELYLTVRDGVFGLSGSGETRPETVPYCPKCEDEPKSGYITPNGHIIIN
jgi:hypothetical protein